MEAVRLDHATINTKNLARSIGFYGHFLDLRPGWRPPLSTDGAWLYPSGSDYAILHLISDADPDDGGGRFNHIAFRGEGLPAYLEKLRLAGATFEAMPVPETPFVQVHHYDPDGVKIEVIFQETADARDLASGPR